MNIKDYFTFYSDPIPVENVFLLTPEVLSDLYCSSSEIEQLNIFFHLQNEYFFLLNDNHIKEAAYICYLISYYLFTPLTPPHSDTLALEFIKKAIDLNSTDEYLDWLEIVKSGN